MDNLEAVVERGWQVGFSHSFELGEVTLYESVGLQKWNEFYIVQISRIEEEKIVDEEFEVEEIKKFDTFNSAIDYIESNSQILKNQLNVSKEQKWFDSKYIKQYFDGI